MSKHNGLEIISTLAGSTTDMQIILLGDVGSEELEYIINHVFLPPKLPQKAEDYTDAKNSTLLKLLQHVAETYLQNGTDSERLQWALIIRMLTNLRSLENGSSLPNKEFRDAIVGMKTGGNYTCRPICWDAC